MLKNSLNSCFSYHFLKEYYNLEDIASKYGMSRMELKHSNYLKWILEYNFYNYFSIKCLITFLKKKTNKLDKVNLFEEITNLKIEREKNNIDILISFIISKQKIVFLIENKINSSLSSEDQLKNYKEKLNETGAAIKIPIILHPDTSKPNSKKLNNDAKENNFIIMTYQNLYEEILVPLQSIIKDDNIKKEIDDYIHCLSNPSEKDDNRFGIIITNEEIDHLKKLINDKMFIDYVEKNDLEKKEELDIILQKYQRAVDLKKIEENTVLNKKIKSIKLYTYKNEQHKKVDYIYYVLKDLIDYYKITSLKEFKLNNVISIYTPLLIPADGDIDTKYRDWYSRDKKIVKRDKTILLGNNDFYYCTAYSDSDINKIKSAIKDNYKEFYNEKIVN